MASTVRNYRDLKAWRESMKLVEMVYGLAKKFSSEEVYGLTNQVRRSAVSVPSNLAEGYARRSARELTRFLLIARGSLAEIETQLILSQRLGYAERELVAHVWNQAQLVGGLVNGLLRSIKNEKPSTSLEPPTADC